MLSLRVHRVLFHISCIFITKPAVFNLLNHWGWPTEAVTNILTAERKTGQSTTVSTAKVMTKMWNEYEDKWHMNPVPRGNIPTLYIIYSMLMFQIFIKPYCGHILTAVYPYLFCLWRTFSYILLDLLYICSCKYLMYTVYNRCSCLFVNVRETHCLRSCWRLRQKRNNLKRVLHYESMCSFFWYASDFQ